LGPITANGAGGLNAGAPKPIKQTVIRKNDQVLAALTTLHAGVNFHFDEDAWRQWYTETHEPANVNLRRAD
jgi:hypothetical protein